MSTVATQDPALQAVAMAVATIVLDRAVMGGDVGDLWEEFPDVGENDWIRISDAVTHIAQELYPPPTVLDEAYATLARRATND